MAAPARQMAAAPAVLPAPNRRRRGGTPARRRRPAPEKRHQTRHLVGRTAHVVTHLPESGAVIGASRSRAWIAVIGILLIGLVAVNVVTVSYGAMASKLDAEIQTLERRNAILKSSETEAVSIPRIQRAAVAAGMTEPDPTELRYLQFRPGDIAAAAQRLAAEGG